MKHKLEELYELTMKDWNNSAWSRTVDIKRRTQELMDEVEEAMEALDKDDMDNYQEELGDVLFDLFSIFVRLEDKHDVDIKDIIQGMIDKLERRKPWILTGKELTIEEESKRWNATKKWEKEQGLR